MFLDEVELSSNSYLRTLSLQDYFPCNHQGTFNPFMTEADII